MKNKMTKKVTVYGIDGTARGSVDISYDGDLADPLSRANAHTVKTVVEAQRANRRLGTVSTKTRTEVRGGGKKPWRQKGTGRARAGSIRSPLWKGGGVVFGPRPRDYGIDVPAKIRKRALLIALVDRVHNDRLRVIDDGFAKPSTKSMAAFLPTAGCNGSVLAVVDADEVNFERSCRNIARVSTVGLPMINTYDVIRTEHILITKKGVEQLVKRYFTGGKK